MINEYMLIAYHEEDGTYNEVNWKSILDISNHNSFESIKKKMKEILGNYTTSDNKYKILEYSFSIAINNIVIWSGSYLGDIEILSSDEDMYYEWKVDDLIEQFNKIEREALLESQEILDIEKRKEDLKAMEYHKKMREVSIKNNEENEKKEYLRLKEIYGK